MTAIQFDDIVWGILEIPQTYHALVFLEFFWFVDDSLKIPAEWIAMERWTLEVAAAAKIRAERQATQLRRFNDVRKKLCTKAPKSHMARFNRAVRNGLWLEAKSLANRYGVRV